MNKTLIRQHLNTLSLVMNHLQKEVDFNELRLELVMPDKYYQDLKHWNYVLKESICDLDTIRQEYQKELDK